MGMKRRMISAWLAVSVFMGGLTLTGCKNNEKRDVKTVSGDSVWFNTQITGIANKNRDKEIEFLDSEFIGTYKDGILVKSAGYYLMPDDFNWKTATYEDYAFTEIDYYSLNGELIKTVDVTKAVYDPNSVRIEDIIVNGDDVNLLIVDAHNSKPKQCLAKVDMDKGTVGESKELVDIKGGSTNIGEYSVVRYEKGAASLFCIINNGKCITVDLSVDIPLLDTSWISSYIQVSETEIILVCESDDIGFISLDLATGEVKNRDEEYSWLKPVNFSIRLTGRLSSCDGKTYITDQEGIKLIDLKSQKLVDVLSYNNCNLNRSTIARLGLLSVKDDKYIFTGYLRF